MSIRLQALIFISTLGLLITQVIHAQTIPSDYIGYWPLDGDASNSVSATNGTVVGAVPTLDRYGNTDAAFHFETDDYIEIANVGSFSSFSISCWMKVDAPQDSWNAIFSYGNRRGGINFTEGTTNLKGFMRNTAEVKFFSSDFPISAGEWTHVALVVDWIGSHTASLYINGGIMETTNLTGSQRSGQNLVLGNEPAHSYFLDGDIDDVIMYSRVLSSSEVQSIFTAGNYLDANCQWSCANGTLKYTSGQVGIGTNNTHGYNLAVVGDILTEGIKVARKIDWPDYVFDDQYLLTDIDFLESFIRECHHLPDVPSSNEVNEKGYDLALMDASLLKKIEELTLYLIEQNRMVSDQQERIDKLEHQVAVLMGLLAERK